MIIIGIETSTYCGSIAVTKNNTLLGECLINTGPRHSEKLMSMIDWLLGQLQLDRDDLDAVSVSRGPGSFTSLRIGMAIAKGMAYSLGIPISGVSSLDTLAMNVSPGSYDICPMLDARRGEVFTKIIIAGEKAVSPINEEVINIRELCGSITSNTIFVGDGAAAYRDIILNCIGGKAHFVPENRNQPRASSMCLISERIRSEVVDNVFTIAPNYLRRSEAEINLKKISET